MDKYSVWLDSAMVYMKRNRKRIVLPKALTVKIIPQFALLPTIEDNLFYFHKINAFYIFWRNKEGFNCKNTRQKSMTNSFLNSRKWLIFLKRIPTRFTINERNRKLAFRKRTICHLCKTVDHNRNGPEEIHALGLKVARLNAEMEK
jgi:hypothetical protein